MSSFQGKTESEPRTESGLKLLAGVIERVTYQNDETGYTVAKLQPERAYSRDSSRDSANLITVVGSMTGVVVGEVLELTGRWKSHPMHGWQFQVENYRSILPATEQGIRKYLGSGLIKGIGPKTAEKIVNRLGTETLEVLERDPERLLQVPGMGPGKVRLITQAWEEQKAIKEVMVFLQGHGVSTSLAVRIYKQYGDAAITVVRHDPYRLAREVWGIGFRTADKIAQALGFSPDDPERLKAGALHALAEASDGDGHTYLPREELVRRACELLGASAEQVEESVSALAVERGVLAERLTVREDGSRGFEPLIPDRTHGTPGSAELREAAEPYDESAPHSATDEGAEITQIEAATPILSAAPGEQAVYLPPFYYAEIGVANSLRRLASGDETEDRLANFRTVNYEAMFGYLAERERLSLTERQQEGVRMALTHPVSVLTGGPGTGKTTSMHALIRVLTLKKKRVVLAAPTGRAAKRLSEATGLEAKTLHRLLQIRPGGKPLYDQSNPIPADMVIVDETSMLDTLLMNNLLKGIATGTHLLLVGDADQLPSVGAGNVLADIIASEFVRVTKLDQIFRQGKDSAIVLNAHKINRGEMPVTGRDIKDFFFFQQDDPEPASELIEDLAVRRVPAKFGYSPSDIQVLAPMHGGRCGVGVLNERIQQALNPPAPNKPQKQYGGRTFRVGDKVLQLRNNYEKEVFNGDSGAVEAIKQEDQELVVRFEDGRTVSYDFSELDELTLAYAISVHKSQGSEYPVCIIPVLMSQYMLLERKLIYTAITRAKQMVVLVGSRKALAIAVRNGPGGASARSARRHGRYTGLAPRLAQPE